MFNQIFINQLSSIKMTYERFCLASKYDDLSDISKADCQSLVTQAIAAVDRVSGRNSIYAREIDRLLKRSPALHHHLHEVLGVAAGLLEDIKAGYLASLAELVSASLFTNYIEMASHLQQSGFKDAAAVVAGATLEAHLRELADRNQVDPYDLNGKPIKAERLNAELARIQVYNIASQKQVTALLDLRNKAAHGNYDAYSAEQINIMILSITEFMARVST